MLLRARDIMRGDERHPMAERDETVKDALMKMTRARSGIVSIIDPKGRLVGVFTDGDFRRLMAEDDRTLERPLRAVMTPKPTTIRESALAADVLKLLDSSRIDDLIVVNRQQKPVGIIDTQDLPRLKLP